MQSEAFGTVAPTDLKQSFNSIADTVVTDHRQSIMAQLRAKQVRAKHPPARVCFPVAHAGGGGGIRSTPQGSSACEGGEPTAPRGAGCPEDGTGPLCTGV